MPKPRASKPSAASTYWSKRLRSKDFRKQLSVLITTELHAVAKLRVEELVEPKELRRIVEAWDRHVVQADAAAAAIVQVQRRAVARLERQQEPLHTLLGTSVAKHLEALLTQDAEPSPEAEAALERLVHQEFVSRLLTDLVFTALVAFYQRVNPLFGNFAMRSLEGQIKSFIRGFLPMLQERIVAFVISRDNQQVAHDLSRMIAQQILNEPIANYISVISVRQHEQAEALARSIVHSDEVDGLARVALLALFDDLYAVVRHKKVGDLLHLDEKGRALAELLADALLPILQRSAIVGFIAAETERFASSQA